jgi:Glycosyltransferase family 87
MREAARRGQDVTRLSAWLSSAALVALLVIPIRQLVGAYDHLAIDFEQSFLPAAEALLDGDSPYPALAYPPLVAFLSVPLALTPSPGALAAAACAACVPAALWILGVRDWRCYVVAFLWCPVFNAVQTANVTLPLLLAASAAWRWRDRTPAPAVSAGLGIALKVLAWPLVVWLAFTRRLRAAVGAVLVAAGVTFGLWAVLGFSGLRSYPDAVDGAQGTFGEQGYTFRALALDAGFSEDVGLVVSFACLGLLLVAVGVFGRFGDDERSFACATVAMVVATPIVWLHSFALLLAPVALLRPRLSPVWFLPAVLWFAAPGTGNGEPWQTVLTIATAAAVVLLALAPARQPTRGRQERSRGRVRRRAVVTE